MRQRCTDTLDCGAFYAQCVRTGEHELGPSFQTITTIHQRDSEALAEPRSRPPMPMTTSTQPLPTRSPCPRSTGRS
ncbi:hypothetical protein [Enhygromyxa salina]|uniref:hypothetical protein n=1 Tax=Enhygromyxa salina TaxID=215803 RepID=UPI003B8A62AC